MLSGGMIGRKIFYIQGNSINSIFQARQGANKNWIIGGSLYCDLISVALMFLSSERIDPPAK
jgi:hypothetical protein